jgi:hypothetical protein
MKPTFDKNELINNNTNFRIQNCPRRSQLDTKNDAKTAIGLILAERYILSNKREILGSFEAVACMIG